MFFDKSTITFNTAGIGLKKDGKFTAQIILSDGVDESYYDLEINTIDQEPQYNHAPFFKEFTPEKTLIKFLP